MLASRLMDRCLVAVRRAACRAPLVRSVSAGLCLPLVSAMSADCCPMGVPGMLDLRSGGRLLTVLAPVVAGSLPSCSTPLPSAHGRLAVVPPACPGKVAVRLPSIQPPSLRAALDRACAGGRSTPVGSTAVRPCPGRVLCDGSRSSVVPSVSIRCRSAELPSDCAPTGCCPSESGCCDHASW